MVFKHPYHYPSSRKKKKNENLPLFQIFKYLCDRTYNKYITTKKQTT